MSHVARQCRAWTWAGGICWLKGGDLKLIQARIVDGLVSGERRGASEGVQLRGCMFMYVLATNMYAGVVDPALIPVPSWPPPESPKPTAVCEDICEGATPLEALPTELRVERAVDPLLFFAPAWDWRWAFPLGNGFLGALLSWNPLHMRVPLSTHSMIVKAEPHQPSPNPGTDT
jgi:hypothetical protein